MKMKPIYAILLVSMLLLVSPARAESPEDKLGVKPEVVHVDKSTAAILASPEKAGKRGYVTVTTYLIDKNGNGIPEVKVVTHYISAEETTSYVTGATYYRPAYSLTHVYLDYDEDLEFDRLIQEKDEPGWIKK